jgi:TP901 family phage tail tape measure protein
MDQTAEAMGTIVETGTEAADAIRVMGVAAEFARAAETDLTDSGQFLVDVMNQFNEPVENLRHLAATINVGSRITATSVAQMRQSFRYAAVESSSLGFSAQEVTAALGALASVGIKGMTAGTRFRQFIVKMMNPTDAARRMARSFGVSLEYITHTAEGQVRPLEEVITRWQDINAQLTEHQSGMLAHAVVGSRALAGGLLFGDPERNRRFRETLEHLSDRTRIMADHQDAARERMRGFAAQMNLTKRAAQELGITFATILFGGPEGEMEFGEWLTDFAAAVRLSDESARTSEVAQEAWSNLTPEMQARGQEWRETFIGLATLLKYIAKAVMWIVKFVGANPTLSAWIIGIGLAIKILLPLIMRRS